ncbi:MAG: hypothetical protein RIE24_24295 [Silicimonas sp.]
MNRNMRMALTLTLRIATVRAEKRGVAGMKRFGAILAAMLAFGLAPAAAQVPDGAPTVISSSQARAIARQALAEGKPQIAGAIADALLQQNPEDAEALLIRALLLRGTGQLDEAREAASAAWRHAEAPAVRFDAAMLTADILARQERFTRSQFWLRRADQAAPDDGRRATAAQAYRTVARRNPLQIGLRFGVKPSNNVNNGAETLQIDIGGLPFRLDDSGQQLGGWEASAGLSFSYRLSENEAQRTEFLADVFYRKVWLDSDAAVLAPGVESSDFDYGAVVTGLRHQRLIWPEMGTSSVTGVLGQSWYGGTGLARWGEVQLGQLVKRSADSALRFGLNLRVERRLDDPINDSESIGFSAEYLRSTGDGGAYSLGASARNVASDSASVDALVVGVSGTRSFGRIGAMQPRLSLGAETRDYQKWAVTPGGRVDRSISIQLDVAWPEVSYYGFVPQASLTARRTWSDVDIYDRNEISLGLTAVSRF